MSDERIWVLTSGGLDDYAIDAVVIGPADADMAALLERRRVRLAQGSA